MSFTSSMEYVPTFIYYLLTLFIYLSCSEQLDSVKSGTIYFNCYCLLYIYGPKHVFKGRRKYTIVEKNNNVSRKDKVQDHTVERNLARMLNSDTLLQCFHKGYKRGSSHFSAKMGRLIPVHVQILSIYEDFSRNI